MSSAAGTVERAIVFDDATGFRRLSALRCLNLWMTALEPMLMQVDLGLQHEGAVLFVVLKLREARFTPGVAATIAAGEASGGRVVPLGELEVQERGAFIARFARCDQRRMGLAPPAVRAALEQLLAQVPERRAEIRRPVEAPATVKVGDKQVPGALQNLSPGGALFRPDAPAPALKEKVQLQLALPATDAKAAATVVRVSPSGVSLQFAPAARSAVQDTLATLPTPKLESQLSVGQLVSPPERRDGAVERVGRYELLSLLGSGGAGEVFYARIAEGPEAGRFVALKRLLPRRAKDPEAVRAFEVEARTLARLKHPNIVRALEGGVFDGQACLVMELIEGHDLAQVVRRARARKRPLPIDVACAVVKAMLDALSAVHDAKDEKGWPLKLVHGDVSPHNLFVAKTGALKLGDFGRTRPAGERARAAIEGRPTYASPEALEGVVDPCVDLWAAGVTLYELLTLETPFAGATFDELTAAIRTQPAPLLRDTRDDCSGPLEALVRSALEKDRAQRPQTAKDFSAALEVHFHPVRAPRQLPDLVRELFS